MTIEWFGNFFAPFGVLFYFGSLIFAIYFLTRMIERIITHYFREKRG